jgi:amidase
MLSGEADGGHDLTKTNQVLSRTVRDSAALFNCTEDKSGQYFPPVGYVSGPSQTRLKVAYVTDKASLTGVEPAVLAAHANTADLLEELGHRVVAVPFPIEFDELFDNYLTFSAGKIAGLKAVVEAASGKPLMDSGLLTPLLATNIENSLRFSASSIERARVYFNTFPRIFERLFQDYDLLLTPVSPVLGVKLNEASFEDSWSDAIANFIVTRLKFTAPINFGGNPAMSAPLNWDPESGMPIGSHFVAARGNDRLLYELAYELESARPWRDRWAPWSLMHPEKFA